jgi:PiT family inorganic phosphate transporter
MAVLLAGELLKNFSGKGLVHESLIANADYTAAVALGAGLTVLLATRLGMPISTTHSLVGALVGAGLAANSSIQWDRLGSSFFLPLLLSPLLAVLTTIIVYPVFRMVRQSLGISAETCLCAGNQVLETIPLFDHCIALERAEFLTVQMGDRVTCQNIYRGEVWGIEAKSMLDGMHFLSAGAVSFARGLNDTPKIAAMLMVLPLLQGFAGMAVVGLAIAVGGILNARRVAETMSQRITPMNAGQGFTANLVTSVIVIGASRFGMPVSTTHVSCGGLFGIGVITAQGQWNTFLKILFAWVTTLPLGCALGAISYAAITSLGTKETSKPAFDETAVDWKHDEQHLLDGLRQAIEFHRSFSQADLKAIGRTLEQFRNLPPAEKDRPSLSSFQVTQQSFVEQLTGTRRVFAEAGFAPFAGRWFGIWEDMEVDHNWSETFAVTLPTNLAEELAIEREAEVQYAWIGDGFGWNYLVTPNGRSSPIVLGHVYHVQPGEPAVIRSEFPHMGYFDGTGRIIWITTGTIFFEEIFWCDRQRR